MRPYNGGNDRQSNGGYGKGNNGGNRQQQPTGGGNTRNGKKQRPRCQICSYWGHEAWECCNRFNQDFQRASNTAATMMQQQTAPPPWLFGTGATDHFTNDLECLHVHERYGGKDQVQIANGTCLSIAHIGHSNLAGSLRLNNILHVLHISQNLL
jgi:hypothetical protein